MIPVIPAEAAERLAGLTMQSLRGSACLQPFCCDIWHETVNKSAQKSNITGGQTRLGKNKQRLVAEDSRFTFQVCFPMKKII